MGIFIRKMRSRAKYSMNRKVSIIAAKFVFSTLFDANNDFYESKKGILIRICWQISLKVNMSSGVSSNDSFSMHASASSIQKVVSIVIADVAVKSIKIRFIQTAVSLKFIQMDESK